MMNTKQLTAKIVIMDDEFFVRQTLVSMLANIPNAMVVGEAEDVGSGIELILEKEPDLILLDIKMPVRSGFDLLEELTHCQQQYGLIFVSGYPDEALTAVQKAAPYFHSDFVVKPIDPVILQTKFSIFYNKWQAAKEQESELAGLLETGIPQIAYKSDQLVFQNSQLFHCIDIDDILYCESANRQINVYCSQYEHINIPNTTLDAIERMLPADAFIRIGKSHILNKSAIRFIQKGNRPKCILARNGKSYEVQLYASNVEKVEQSYSITRK
ncbi:LytTR family DNA-binding domain-containing protein [Dyadobacter sp. LJ53]|uniref:LytR/AlgR family response regulator transcription factor n=1 Tax=Dyadobacter chenwenxiniae TaxID=2906456 RepID=UPI001F42C17B|nr:LytTR family DNA-binding domain-containing protein [Dyadobacter chenwenxiniae]MCF0049035.1 LytTR family DNA-binding domain-containing protein [Dyadobacter chenwenxiniae]